MASAGIANSWRVIGLDTGSNESSAAPSRSHSFISENVVYARDDSFLEHGGLEISTRRSIERLSSIDLSATLESNDDQRGDLTNATGVDDSVYRIRKKSISFHPQAKLDNGDKFDLEQPLPRTGSLRSVNTTERPNNGRRPVSITPTIFDPATCKINPFTGEAVQRRRPRRQDTASSGLSIMDLFNRNKESLLQETDPNHASLTSASTASPPRDEIATPVSPSGSYVNSPITMTSPTLENEPWPVHRSGSVRSGRTIPNSRPMSLRQGSRRSSRRTADSASFSPASAFLYNWGQETMPTAVPEPDDEGQSFGMENEYVIGRQIGYGGFSVVKEAFGISDEGDKLRLAVKIVRKNIREKGESDNDKCQQELEHEVGIWKYLEHDHVLSLRSVFDSDFATFCVMDLNEGGTLYDLIRDSRKANGKPLLPETVQSYAHQLALALRYLHEDVRIVHRDVKMENCLIEQDRSQLGDQPGRLRLCDFGLADFITSNSVDSSIDGSTDEAKDPGKATNVMGSLEYAAPEVMRTPEAILSPTVDIWAFGACVYTLIARDRPFKHSMAAKLVELINRAEWDEQVIRHSPSCGDWSDDIVDLLRGCLDPDATTRWTIGEVIQARWFEGTGAQ